jgi:hypothetical protein
MPAGLSKEQNFILSSHSPSSAQKRLALTVVLALVAAFVIAAGPLSTIQPGRIDAFVPAYAMSLFVTDLITAVLLYAQFSILRSRALHRAYCDPVDADLSGRVHARWLAWRRAADHELALYSVAHRFSDIRHRVCPVEGYISDQ